MNRSRADAFLLAVPHLDHSSEQPLYRQIYSGIREGILQGRLVPSLRLPSSRDLAELLGVSRNTVLNAFDLLLAEGYLDAQTGAGTFVTEKLPEEYLNALQRKAPEQAIPRRRTLSRRGASFAQNHAAGRPARLFPVFPHGIPDLAAFPFDVWSRLTAKRLRETPPYHFGYGQAPGGYEPLLQSIADYLGAARAVRCTPEQIVVVSGSQHGLFLAGQVLLDPGDRAWIEEPGYLGAHAALLYAGAEPVPVTVDAQGLDLAAAKRAVPARLAYVTPSHQLPLGYTMSLARRTRLLQWAANSDGWIVEDDYDSEFRYKGAPLPSLQGLDVNRRVIYVGTFSKTLFPGLRLGYLVVPEDLVEVFITARNAVSLAPPFLAQAVVNDFLEQGHFSRHIRRMRRRYARRRDVFVAAMQEELGDIVQLGPSDAGLHVTAWLPPELDDVLVWQRAQENEVTVLPLSWLCQQPPARKGLVLGFALAPEEDIRSGVQRLARAIEEATKMPPAP
ncbi:MAG TPA: PLP-dependent aminotransferase family protein [Candidatus Binatia bacterium]|nr:PLP-dependent aminotransferase family protein [Candidatus Binatia bacterium]